MSNPITLIAAQFFETTGTSVPTPPTGSMSLYFNPSGTLNTLNSSGTSAAVGGGGGSGTVTSVVAGTGLTGGTITTTGTIALANGRIWVPESLLGSTRYGTDGLDFAGSYTMGTSFYVTQSLTFVGFKFYYPDATAKTLKCSLRNAAGTVLQTVNVNVSGAGVYTATLTGTALTPYAIYKMTSWENSGVHGYAINNPGTMPAGPNGLWNGAMLGDGYVRLQSWYAAGDADPTTTGTAYIMMQEPVFQ